VAKTSAHKARRNKPYRLKQIHLPVMPELQKEFMFASHGSLAALRMAPSADAYDQLADLFNVICVALQDTGGRSVILESGMRAMQDVCVRAERIGQIGLGRFELPPIENAVIECESIVKQLDVIRLYHARIKTTYAARISRALSNHTNLKEAA
jgi:hypothetical protein